MFSDLVGSTALSAGLDPEDMRQFIRAYQDAVSGVVARYDGFIAKFMGDGVLAYFGFPRAHEDDAARAVLAGLEIAEVVAALQTRAPVKLGVRVGIATGLVVVGDLVGHGSAQEQAVVGDTPNLAARLQGLVESGGVVVSAATRRLIGDQFLLKGLGRHPIKGLVEPVEAFAVLGVSVSESRFHAAHPTRLTDFVGREAESTDLLMRMRRAWGGHGQIALISGEPGIGKSRLSAWLAEQVGETPHTRLRYKCSPYHRDSALYPFVQQFERAAGITPQESPEAKLEKLETVLGLATDRTGEVAPLVASMLSIPLGTRYPALNLSPAQQRRQTLSALLNQMEGLAPGRYRRRSGSAINPRALTMIEGSKGGRSLEPLDGVVAMQRNRGVQDLRDLMRGPGRRTAALDIDRRLDGVDLCRTGPLWLGCDAHVALEIGASARIGLSRETDRVLRFYARGNPFVSGPKKLND